MADSIFAQWSVEYESGIPVYRQIINLACAAVAAGTLRNGDQLPTIRALSVQLQVNPNTVAKAYRELELKGLIVSERGSGSFIQAPSAATEAAPSAVPAKETPRKAAELKKLYEKFMAEAASQGMTEAELLNFIKTQTPSTL
ncbi:MAG TPA: GntR family transcriptional regulator [Candidatus Sulfotelmatobacter sp.]|nr:GntR family transcriptional regulator [Candidatus Sulfotelmatobacter sp.]